MQTRIALLRGVNVSGKYPVDMKQLVHWMTESGLHDCKYYIQSGNLIYKSDREDSATLISGILSDKLGYDVPTLALDLPGLEAIVSAHPALKDTGADEKKIYFTFLLEEPEEDRWQKLEAFRFDGEVYYRGKKVVYFYAGNGYGSAKMNNNFFESKLGVSATTRNLNTCKKLVQMAKDV